MTDCERAPTALHWFLPVQVDGQCYRLGFETKEEMQAFGDFLTEIVNPLLTESGWK